MPSLAELQQRYAELLIRTGINLQPGQGLLIRAELGHAELVRLAIAAAYDAGASYVHVDWFDEPSVRAMLQHANMEKLQVPNFDITRHRQFADEKWARLSIVGSEFPGVFGDVDPQRMRTWAVRRAKSLKFYTDAMMANQIQWCVAAVPTPAWAQQIYPDKPVDDAVETLWHTVLHLARADHNDPVAAWRQHSMQLTQIATFMHKNQVRSLHFVDPTPVPDGKPATDLVIGLAERPRWVGGAAQTPAGVEFHPNMPTEEIFCTPHNQQTEGYVCTSRPTFPMQREVDGAWFRFEKGQVVDFHARVGQDVLAQFFEIEGARRLGEVSLVDISSPVFQSGLLFHEILFDENAACHIAFGESYPECIEGGDTLTREELSALGANTSDTHVDFMIGTPTMCVTGRCHDGREVPIMDSGRFVAAIFED